MCLYEVRAYTVEICMHELASGGQARLADTATVAMELHPSVRLRITCHSRTVQHSLCVYAMLVLPHQPYVSAMWRDLPT